MNRRAITRRFLPAACAGLGLTIAAQAQTLIRSVDGGSLYDRAGASIANAGDVNGDGHPDTIVGAPQDFMIFFEGPGFARVISGLDGSTIHTFVGDADIDLFGFSVAGVGDLNNDGYDDVAVGAPYAIAPAGILSHGLVRVFSGQDGSTLFSVYGEEDDELGRSLAGAGDVNGDGTPDVIVGAPRGDAPDTGSGPISSAGKALVLSGVDGSLIHEIYGTAGNQRLGYSVAAMGNINEADMVLAGEPPVLQPDSFDDVIIGSLFGGAKIFSGFDASVLSTFNSGASEDIYGRTVGSVKDLNGDGVRDAILGATQEDFFSPSTGYVEVRSGIHGNDALLFSMSGAVVSERFGASVADAGDWDGDGLNDVLVGTSPSGSGIASYASLYSGADGSLLFSLTSAVNAEHFGYAVAGLGDGDGDGRVEIGVTAPEAQPNGLGSGSARVYESPFSSCGTVTSYCPVSANSSGGPGLLSHLGTTGVASNDLVFVASGLPTNNQPGIFFYGNNAQETAFGAGTLCVAGPYIKRLQMVTTGSGFAIYGLDITAENAPDYEITPGSTWFFQYWHRDPGFGANFTNALQINFCE